ncbi:MAG: BrnA antitoxin family protein [Fibrobacter sp.]|nr:BrnA antitoxin family protein [Fibrobacter sp.]
MKVKNLKKQSGTDWERLSTMSDKEINLSENPELDDSFFSNAALRMPEPKKSVNIRLDQDILEWYKQQGPGYQTRMNAVLRMYMQVKSGNARKVPNRRRTRKKLGKSEKN